MTVHGTFDNAFRTLTTLHRKILKCVILWRENCHAQGASVFVVLSRETLNEEIKTSVYFAIVLFTFSPVWVNELVVDGGVLRTCVCEKEIKERRFRFVWRKDCDWEKNETAKQVVFAE